VNGRRALFDSNTVIYLSKRDIPLSFLEQYDEHFFSVITYMEVLGYQLKEPREEEYINELLGLFRTIYVDQKVADRVVEIRKNIGLNYRMPLLLQRR
jgi:predicted nucleic acid-binding protein